MSFIHLVLQLGDLLVELLDLFLVVFPLDRLQNHILHLLLKLRDYLLLLDEDLVVFSFTDVHVLQYLKLLLLHQVFILLLEKRSLVLLEVLDSEGALLQLFLKVVVELH